MTKKDTVLPNLIVSISGEPKTGKSHLMLTFPAPLVVFSFDIGIEPVKKKFVGKDIEVITYPVPIIDSVKATGFQKDIRKIWDSFTEDYKHVCADARVVTIGIDTSTALYEIARIARACELGQENLLQFQYGDVYARMKSIIQRPRVSGQNLVLTHYLRDRYVKNENTGELELDGYKYTESEVDVVLETKLVAQTTKDGKKNKVITTVKNNRYLLETNGVELEMATFDDLITILGIGE